MGGADQYVALVASLPRLERLFFAKQPPLSRLRLEKRLAQLEPPHAEALARIERVLSWGAYPMDLPGADAAARAERAIAETRQPTLRAIVGERFELRVLVAALRRRAQGGGPPGPAAGWGRWAKRVAANWSEPAFGLRGRHVWLPEAAALIGRRDAMGLERLLLEVSFRRLQRRGAEHHFDFEAVAIYVLKWNIFDRWARLNGEAAMRRFDALARDALAELPPSWPDGEPHAAAG